MIDLKEMLKAGIHFGHKTSRWSPAMAPYIWGSRNKIHLIDVSKTAFLLERTAKFLKNLASEGKSFLWVGTKKPAQGSIKKVATSLKMPFVIHRWIGGTLSNFDQIKKALTKFLHLKDAVDKSTYYKKKEISMMQKELAKLEKNIGGILDLEYPPAAVIIVDAKKEFSAVKEALKLNIPTIAIVDTNTNPEGINFIIPANDDSHRSITFILDYLASSVLEGKKEFEAQKEILAKEEKVKKTTQVPTIPKVTTKEEKETKKPIEKKTTITKVEIKKANEKSTAKTEKTTVAKTTRTTKPATKGTTKTEKTTSTKKVATSRTETKKMAKK